MQCPVVDRWRDREEKKVGLVMDTRYRQAEPTCIIWHSEQNAGLPLFIYVSRRQKEELRYAMSGCLVDLPLEERKTMSRSGVDGGQNSKQMPSPK